MKIPTFSFFLETHCPLWGKFTKSYKDYSSIFSGHGFKNLEILKQVREEKIIEKVWSFFPRCNCNLYANVQAENSNSQFFRWLSFNMKRRWGTPMVLLSIWIQQKFSQNLRGVFSKYIYRELFYRISIFQLINKLFKIESCQEIPLLQLYKKKSIWNSAKQLP